jgi:hypothetical protein
MTDLGFANLAGGDYRLAATSPYHHAATDGTDVGANIDGLNGTQDPPAGGETASGGGSSAIAPVPPPPGAQWVGASPDGKSFITDTGVTIALNNAIGWVAIYGGQYVAQWNGSYWGPVIWVPIPAPPPGTQWVSHAPDGLTLMADNAVSAAWNGEAWVAFYDAQPVAQWTGLRWGAYMGG